MTRLRMRHAGVLTVLAVEAAVLLAGCSKPASEAEGPQPKGGMALTSPAFREGGSIPADYTADGRNVSPPLEWTDAPEGAATFALIVDDPDAPLGAFVHWLICEMPGRTRALPEAVPKQEDVSSPVVAVQGNNGFRQVGYGGPRPPKGETHRYVFRLFALDAELHMSGGFNKKQLEEAMKGHILAQARLVGKYGR